MGRPPALALWLPSRRRRRRRRHRGRGEGEEEEAQTLTAFRTQFGTRANSSSFAPDIHSPRGNGIQNAEQHLRDGEGTTNCPRRKKARIENTAESMRDWSCQWLSFLRYILLIILIAKKGQDKAVQRMSEIALRTALAPFPSSASLTNSWFYRNIARAC